MQITNVSLIPNTSFIKIIGTGFKSVIPSTANNNIANLYLKDSKTSESIFNYKYTKVYNKNLDIEKLGIEYVTNIVLNNNDIYVCGSSWNYNNVTALVKINNDFAIDIDFLNNFIPIINSINSINIDNVLFINNYLYVINTYSGGLSNIYKLNLDGTLINTYTYDRLQYVKQYSNNELFIIDAEGFKILNINTEVVQVLNSNIAIDLLNSVTTLDQSRLYYDFFDLNDFQYKVTVYNILLQEVENVSIVLGTSSARKIKIVNNNVYITTGVDLIKCDLNLNIDINFQINNFINYPTSFESGVFDFIVNNDDSIIVVGAFNKVSGTTTNSVCKLNSNGSIDSMFTVQPFYNEFSKYNAVYSIFKLDNDDLLLGCFRQNPLQLFRYNSNELELQELNTPTVLLNSTQSPRVTFISSTELNVELPLNLVAGTYNIMITNPTGETATLVNGYTHI